MAAMTRSECLASPFGDEAALRALCEHVVLLNVQLRPSDAELVQENPQEHILWDVDGGNKGTRCRAALDLIQAWRRFSNGEACELLSGYAGELLEQAAAAPEDQGLLYMDTCVHVVMALTGPPVVKDVASLVSTRVVEQFFAAHVAPELQAEPLHPKRAMLRVACLKFVMLLRGTLPAPVVLSVLPAVCRHIMSDNPVVHTYAAFCANVVSSLQGDACGPDGQKNHRSPHTVEQKRARAKIHNKRKKTSCVQRSRP